MRTRLRTILLIALVAAPAFAAGGSSGDFELGLYTGYGLMDDYGNALPEDGILFGGRAGWFFTPRWSLELSFQRLDSETDNPMFPAQDFDIDSGRLNFLYNFRPDRSFRPYLTAGAGVESLDVANVDSDDESFNAGGGLRWFVSPVWALRLDARWVRTDVQLLDNQNNIEISYGLSWAFGGGAPTDSDGDGVSDRKDRCSNTPQGATVDERGCPSDGDADSVYDGIDRCPDTPRGYPVDDTGCPLDSDGDGVPDGRDDCPATPRGARVDSSGCPRDADGDGVYDGIDQCPDTPPRARVDAQGCPADADGDGVFDGLDRCPDTPRGARVDENGCPLDSDGDTVFDGIDQCPDTPRGTRVDEKGCQILFEEEQTQLVLEDVNFEFNSAQLTANARTILDHVAAALVANPEVRVEVGGHTDSKGRDSYNMELSQQRAEAVRNYLISRGVAGARMRARGYGETQPIADNNTDAGRARNRRVALKKLE